MKFVGISNCENSYCSATCTEYFANVTEHVVATSGLTPAMPATMKYVVVRSNLGETTSEATVLAALISKANH